MRRKAAIYDTHLFVFIICCIFVKSTQPYQLFQHYIEALSQSRLCYKLEYKSAARLLFGGAVPDSRAGLPAMASPPIARARSGSVAKPADLESIVEAVVARLIGSGLLRAACRAAGGEACRRLRRPDRPEPGSAEDLARGAPLAASELFKIRAQGGGGGAGSPDHR